MEQLGIHADSTWRHRCRNIARQVICFLVAKYFSRMAVAQFLAKPKNIILSPEEYNPFTNRWVTLAPMPVPRHGLGAIAAEDSSFVIGGGTEAGFSVSNVNSIFIPPSNPTSVLPSGGPLDGFALAQNHPNPFNPETQISFELPKLSNARLIIYDILGRRIKTLVNEELNAGYYSVMWDGGNSRGLTAASGVYVYRLEASITTAVGKMLLLR